MPACRPKSKTSAFNNMQQITTTNANLISSYVVTGMYVRLAHASPPLTWIGGALALDAATAKTSVLMWLSVQRKYYSRCAMLSAAAAWRPVPALAQRSNL